ncbi:MAG: GIN domain-containing protein [Muribaculaceae bacterium]
MKRLFSILSVLMVLTMAASVQISAKGVDASKKVLKKTYNVNDFNGLSAVGSFDVEYSYGDPSVVVSGPDNIVPLLEVKLVGSTVQLAMQKGVSINYGINKPRLVVKVSSHHLVSASLTGSGDMKILSPLNEESFTGRLHGSGDFETAAISVKKCSLDFNGSGDMSVGGAVIADEFSIDMHGSGDVKVKSASAVNCNINTTGSGDFEIGQLRATKDINLNVRGSSDTEIALIDAANINCSSFGSGEVEVRNVGAQSLRVSLNGSGSIDMKRVKADALDCNVLGTGDVELQGTTSTADYTINGTGSIKAFKMAAVAVKASTRGTGSINCNAQSSLNSSIEGPGDITYTGNAKVTSATKKQPRKR